MKYRLPTIAYDCILYSGLHYVGRDTLLITSSDAVVSIGGRLGTLHEFTIAMETGTPIGFLQGAGGISEEIQTLMSLAHPLRPSSMVAFSDDSTQLVKELTDHLDIEHAKYKNLYQ
jgi:predicted Rossmann-fold nucleotide-binding protein